MNVFDTTVVSAVNQYAQRSWAFDNAVFLLSNKHLLKGGVLTTLIWWLWFRDDPHQANGGPISSPPWRPAWCRWRSPARWR